MRLRYVAAGLILLWTSVGPGYTSDAPAASGEISRLWRLAAQEQQMLEQRGIVLGDASVSGYLQSVAERLWEQVPSGLSAPTVKIIMDTRIDAYAYPNGQCYLSTGMLGVLKNESQLAMILAHELIHYTRQHTAALYNHFQQTAPTNHRQNDGRIDMAGDRRAVQPSIDAAERQADREGLAVLMAAGYDQGEVVPLMSNLVKRMLDQGQSESAGQLEHRAALFNKRVAEDRGKQSGRRSTGTVPDDYRDHIAPALMVNAQIALRRGEWDQADRSLSQFLELKPADARAHYLKGEILRRQNGSGGDNTCIRYFEKALTIDPKFSLAHRALGELHFKAGRYQMAKPYLETFLSLAPEDTARAYIKGYLGQCQK